MPVSRKTGKANYKYIFQAVIQVVLVGVEKLVFI